MCCGIQLQKSYSTFGSSLEMGGQNWSSLSCGRQPWGAPTMILSPGTHAFVQSPPVRVGWTGGPLLINRMWRKWWDMLPAEASERLWAPPCCCSLVLASACWCRPAATFCAALWRVPHGEELRVASGKQPRGAEVPSPTVHGIKPWQQPWGKCESHARLSQSPNESSPGWWCESGRPVMSPGSLRHRSVVASVE